MIRKKGDEKWPTKVSESHDAGRHVLPPNQPVSFTTVPTAMASNQNSLAILLSFCHNLPLVRFRADLPYTRIGISYFQSPSASAILKFPLISTYISSVAKSNFLTSTLWISSSHQQKQKSPVLKLTSKNYQ